MSDPETVRTEQLEHWESAATGWGRRAGSVREWGMPVSMWLIEHLALQPGERLLELAAGPGDTGFMAAELIAPGGTFICSDASERMLEVARGRAERLGMTGVEFRQLQLEWIDLDTASVDAVVCRWGVMLTVDPASALQECRRVLRPGGRAALAVWDERELNPWATATGDALFALGHAAPPPAGTPHPFALSDRAELAELIEAAGFVELEIDSVELVRAYPDFDSYLDESLDLSQQIGNAWARLSDDQQAELMQAIEERVAPYRAADGSLELPGRSLVALAAV